MFFLKYFTKTVLIIHCYKNATNEDHSLSQFDWFFYLIKACVYLV